MAARTSGRPTLGGCLGRRYELTWRGNLLALDWDHDFLAPFVSKEASGDYVGLGKSLEALVRFAAATAEPELLALRESLLTRLLAAQEPDGYLGRHRREARTDQLWDVHELAYLVLALVTDHRLFKAAASLRAAVAVGDYLLDQLTPPRLAVLAKSIGLHLGACGLDRALLALYHATGERRYRDFLTTGLALPSWDLPILEGRYGRIEGHAYAYLSRALAQLELSGESRPSTRAERFLQHGGLVVSGTCSQSECWHSDQRGHGELGETCATAYLMRWQNHLLAGDGLARHGDLLERALYNALFAAQSPDGRKLRYYTPCEGERQWWPRDTYCCPGNFRRIIAELPELIAAPTAAGIRLNLYSTMSRCFEHPEAGEVRLTVETDYPTSGEVRLLVEPERSACFALELRVPGWCETATVAVNGETSNHRPGMLRMHRCWSAGDRVELALPMPWRWVRGSGVNAGKAALLRGPQLFCLD
ncbi:MAG: glycoside hydrolase family 127 protein, partial [Armatimonadetes bacterium]|nr:glycoside hydrolase family 127 protein [Armatimonadota bacterium]